MAENGGGRVTARFVIGSLLLALVASSCRNVDGVQTAPGSEMKHPDLPSRPSAPASSTFRSLWYDGNAELSGYRITLPRYGQKREGELVLIYVTEPVDRTTLIKDDHAPPDRRVDVMKLNANLDFLAGIYPYSVMTSVFAPIDDWGVERFSPVKISFTAQEWCGHVFHAVWPGRGFFESRIASYFSHEGERSMKVTVPEETLYEDALLIQLRELDGPFAEGKDWQGSIVPSLWRTRTAHVPPAPGRAFIRRSVQESGPGAITRFELESGDYRRTFDVELQPPRRVVRWVTSDGEEAELLRTARLPYWKLNRVGDEKYREQIGVPSGRKTVVPGEHSDKR